jgi:aspartate kinase
MTTVAKFGGSSVANETMLALVKDIVLKEPARQVVVVSAPGRSKENDSKITDMLFLLHAHLEYNINHSSLLEAIYNRYKTIVDNLQLSNRFEQAFRSFQQELATSIRKDYLVSRGEYFSAMIIAEYLGYEFVDALSVIRLQYDGSVDYKETKEQLLKYRGKQIVIPGFYGGTPDNQVRLFSRGGSDLTGSIVARAMETSIYENWTDVSGIYVADPTIVQNPKRITEITYNELRELAYRGANVIQQESVIPVEQTDIPIHILNTMHPEEPGTIITNDVQDNASIITGMSVLSGYAAINITKQSNHNVTSVLRDVLDLFLRYRLRVEHIPTGIDTFSVITKRSEIKDVYFDFMNDLRNIDGVTTIEEETDIALIAIVGRNMAHIPGVAGRIFSTLGHHKINIKVIAQASKEISIIIGVKEDDYNQAINVLYQEFY